MINNRLDRIRSLAEPRGSRLPLALLLVATGASTVLACSSDDDGGSSPTTTAQPSQPIVPVLVDPVTPREPENDFVQQPMGPMPNGVTFPMGVQDWRVIGAAARTDNDQLRVIVGNDIAVEAARAGQTDPWPDGSMLAHLAWSTAQNPDDENTQGPGDFAVVTLMMRDSTRFADQGNWTYGAWAGPQLMPNADPNFETGCIDCHTNLVSDKDMVFTNPGQLPAAAAFADVDAAPNGIEFPEEILDWRVIGIANVAGDTPTLRVIVGNDIAVDAARAGQTNPWPDGSVISHYVWAAGENEDSANTVAPGDFVRFTYMVRDEEEFAADNNWAFATWAGADLAAPTDPEFDRACVNCHTDTVADNDMVFTRPGALPPSMITPPAAQ